MVVCGNRVTTVIVLYCIVYTSSRTKWWLICERCSDEVHLNIVRKEGRTNFGDWCRCSGLWLLFCAFFFARKESIETRKKVLLRQKTLYVVYPFKAMWQIDMMLDPASGFHMQIWDDMKKNCRFWSTVCNENLGCLLGAFYRCIIAYHILTSPELLQPTCVWSDVELYTIYDDWNKGPSSGSILDFGDVYPPWNYQFAPENGWLEYDRFLLGPGLFSGANC